MYSMVSGLALVMYSSLIAYRIMLLISRDKPDYQVSLLYNCEKRLFCAVHKEQDQLYKHHTQKATYIKTL